MRMEFNYQFSRFFHHSDRGPIFSHSATVFAAQLAAQFSAYAVGDEWSADVLQPGVNAVNAGERSRILSELTAVVLVSSISRFIYYLTK